MTTITGWEKAMNITLMPWQREFAAAVLRGDRITLSHGARHGVALAWAVVRDLVADLIRQRREAELAEVREINRALPFKHPIAQDRGPAIRFGKADEFNSLAPTIRDLARMTPIYGLNAGPFILSGSVA